MQLLKKGIVIQKYLLIILLIGIFLSLERYFTGIIPFTGGYLIPIYFSLSYICLVVLYVSVFLLIIFQLLKKIFKFSIISFKEIFLNYIIKYSIGIIISFIVLFFMFFLLSFHKIEIKNQTNQVAKNITITTSFTSRVNDVISGMDLGEIKTNSSETWNMKNLEDLPLNFKRKITLSYNIDNQQQKIQKRTSLFRTKFIIDGKSKVDGMSKVDVSINCETELNYREINNKSILITTINLCNSLLNKYTIDIERFDDSNSSYLIINTPKQFEIKNVERILYWYPSIWSKSGENLYQYIRLDNLIFQTTENLRVLSPKRTEEEILLSETHNNIVYYSDPDNLNYNLNYFSSIETKEIKKSIISQLSKSKDNYMNFENKKYEKEKWLNYADKYNKDDFLNKSNEIYSVDYFDVYLKITFKTEKEDYVRVLHQNIIIGN